MKLKYAGRYLWMSAMLAVSVAFWVQFKRIRDLNSQVVALQKEVAGLTGQDERVPAPAFAHRDPALSRSLSKPDPGPRLAHLERAVARLIQASDYLMERGDLPLTENKIRELSARFADATLDDEERIRALKLLRKNKAVTDEVAQSAVAWLQTTTNSRTKEEVLNQLEGATNAALKQTLVDLTADANSRVREQSVENLGHLTADPQVENLLWGLLANDPSEDVREEAEKALGNGTVSEARAATLRLRALNPETSLTASLVALRALNHAGVDVTEELAAMVARSQSTQDPTERAEIFRAFDDGIKDPSLLAPLVQGLQDPSPEVRQSAADALSDYNNHPAVQEWLQYVAQHDADPRVRKEAADALPDN